MLVQQNYFFSYEGIIFNFMLLVFFVLSVVLIYLFLVMIFIILVGNIFKVFKGGSNNLFIDKMIFSGIFCFICRCYLFCCVVCLEVVGLLRSDQVWYWYYNIGMGGIGGGGGRIGVRGGED